MKLNRRFFVAALALAASLSAYAELKPAKYVILMIGDGMGPEQVRLAEAYQYAKTGKTLELNRLPVKGSCSTYSANNPVTDSAAAGTALACGQKTKNGVISMHLESVAEVAKKHGKKVGIITSVPIDHATPAVFYAHQPSRNNYYEIACSLPASGFNYFAGQPFLGTERAKGRPDPQELAQAAGYHLIRTVSDFRRLRPPSDNVLVQTEMPYSIDEEPGDITLADLTKKGLEMLDNPNGFFLMVEGGKIDWAGHANDLAANIKETLAFDEAVAAATDFYADHEGETLLIITADHETGGLKPDFSGAFNFATLDQQKISGAEFGHAVKQWKKSGTTFEQALKQIETSFGLTHLSGTELAEITQAYDAVMSNNPVKELAAAIAKMYGDKNPVVLTCQKIVARRCGVTWSSFHHTASLVPVAATGVNADLFGGQIDNTDIGKTLRTILQE